jgi:hypothetical protein
MKTYTINDGQKQGILGNLKQCQATDAVVGLINFFNSLKANEDAKPVTPVAVPSDESTPDSNKAEQAPSDQAVS